MFTPRELDLERGWPGRIEGDRVVQLAAQTLQAFFTGGGAAREHDAYPLDEVVLRAPVLHPPSVRMFEGDDFVFANPAAVHGPNEPVRLPEGADEIRPVLRLAAVVGADGEVGGHTLMSHWHAPSLSGQKAHDFAITLGPVVLTPPQEAIRYDDWERLLAHAGRNTRLVPGDVIAAGSELRPPARGGDIVELDVPPFGTLRVPIVG